jgi:hypothetical protein
MNNQRKVLKSFSESDIKSFEPEMKVGLLATINEEGLPHVTLLSSLCASSPTELVFGQFSEGLSKVNVRKNPKAGFLILTLDRNNWRGKANFTHIEKSGKEFDIFNNMPMFRYNAYFGIHTVYYFDLIEQYGKEPLPMGSIVQSALKTMLAKMLSPKKGKADILNPWTRQLIDKISNLKFLAYVTEDGYPTIIPVIQAQTSGTENVIFAASAFKEDIKAIPANTTVAFFCMSFDMEDVLLRGAYQGIQRIGGVQCGSISVNWVYSPMPPKSEQIYPEIKLDAVTTF